MHSPQCLSLLLGFFQQNHGANAELAPYTHHFLLVFGYFLGCVFRLPAALTGHITDVFFQVLVGARSRVLLRLQQLFCISSPVWHLQFNVEEHVTRIHLIQPKILNRTKLDTLHNSESFNELTKVF